MNTNISTKQSYNYFNEENIHDSTYVIFFNRIKCRRFEWYKNILIN